MKLGTKFQEKVLKEGTFAISISIRRKLAFLDFLIAASTTSSIVLQYREYDDYYKEIVSFSSKYPYETLLSDKTESLTCSSYRLLTGICSAISGLLVSLRFKYEIELSKILGEISYKESYLQLKGRLFGLLLEIISLCLFLPPYINAVSKTTQHDRPMPISLDMLFTILMLPRMIYTIRAYFSFFNYIYYRDEGLHHVIKKYPVNPPTFLARAHLKFYPYTSLSLLIAILTVNIGLCLRVPERTFVYFSEKDWEDIANNFWMVIVVITSVGYGDYFPTTHFGRLFTVIAAILGTFFISLMVLIMSDNITFNKLEKRAYSKIKEQEIINKYKKEAALLILRALRLNWFLSREGGDIKRLIEMTYRSKNSEQAYRYSFASNKPKNALVDKLKMLQKPSSDSSITANNSSSSFLLSDSLQPEGMTKPAPPSASLKRKISSGDKKYSIRDRNRKGSNLDNKIVGRNRTIKKNTWLGVQAVNQEKKDEQERKNQGLIESADPKESKPQNHRCLITQVKSSPQIAVGTENKRDLLLESKNHSTLGRRRSIKIFSMPPKSNQNAPSSQNLQEKNLNNGKRKSMIMEFGNGASRDQKKKNNNIRLGNRSSSYVDEKNKNPSGPMMNNLIFGLNNNSEVASAQNHSDESEVITEVTNGTSNNLNNDLNEINSAEAKLQLPKDQQPSPLEGQTKQERKESTVMKPRKSIFAAATKESARPRKSIVIEQMKNLGSLSNSIEEANKTSEKAEAKTKIARKSIVFDQTKRLTEFGQRINSRRSIFSETNKSTSEHPCKDQGNPFQCLASGNLEKNDRKLACYYIGVKFQVEVCKKARAAVIGLKYDVNMELLIDRQKKSVEEMIESLKKNADILSGVEAKFIKVEKRLDFLEKTVRSMILRERELIKKIEQSFNENNELTDLKIKNKDIIESLDCNNEQTLPRPRVDMKKMSQNLNPNIYNMTVHEERSEDENENQDPDSAQNSVSSVSSPKNFDANQKLHPPAPSNLECSQSGNFDLEIAPLEKAF